MKLLLQVVSLYLLLLAPIRASWCTVAKARFEQFDGKNQTTTTGQLFTNPVVPHTSRDPGYHDNIISIDFLGFFATDPSHTAAGAPITQGLCAHTRPNVAAASLAQESPIAIQFHHGESDGSFGIAGFWFGCLGFATEVGASAPVNCSVNVSALAYGIEDLGYVSEVYNFTVAPGTQIAKLVYADTPDFDGSFESYTNMTIVPDPEDVVVLFDGFEAYYNYIYPTSTGCCGPSCPP